MNLRYGDRPFSHGGCHPFHRPGAHVAGGEHAGQAGFQRQRCRLACFGPAGPHRAGQAGQEELPRPVARDDIIGQPVGVRGGADHDEQRRRWHRLLAAGGPVAQD